MKPSTRSNRLPENDLAARVHHLILWNNFTSQLTYFVLVSVCVCVSAGEPSTPPWSRALLRRVTPQEHLPPTNCPHCWGTTRAKTTSRSARRVGETDRGRICVCMCVWVICFLPCKRGLWRWHLLCIYCICMCVCACFDESVWLTKEEVAQTKR